MSKLTDEINRVMISSTSRLNLGNAIFWFVRNSLNDRLISLYEAYILMEYSERLNWCDASGSAINITDADVIEEMNMALLAKLFNDQQLHDFYFNRALEMFADCKKRYAEHFSKHFIFSHFQEFLSGQCERMKELKDVRANTRRNNYKQFPHHYDVFPYDYFCYEEELIKILKGEIDHYDVDKTISPEVCDMMVAIELRADELS